MTVALTWLGHATVVLDIDGVRLVADPLLRRHNGVLRRRGGARPGGEAWSQADAALLTMTTVRELVSAALESPAGDQA